MRSTRHQWHNRQGRGGAVAASKYGNQRYTRELRQPRRVCEQNLERCSCGLDTGHGNGDRPGPTQSPRGPRPAARDAAGRPPATAEPRPPAGSTVTASLSCETQATELGASSAASLPERGALAAEHPRAGVPLSAGVCISPLDNRRHPAADFPLQRVLLRQLCASGPRAAARRLSLGALRTRLVVG